MDGFYDMVKKWTVNDYHTPKAKAEVILDMLVSEFIGEFCKKLPGEGVPRLLTKEFPIRAKTEAKGTYSASVDYLVDKGKVLYLTELKTDLGSFRDGQFATMVRAKESGVSGLFSHYQEVLWKTKHKKKYLYQVRQLWKNTHDGKPSDDFTALTSGGKLYPSIEKFLKEQAGADRSVEILYLTLTSFEDLFEKKEEGRFAHRGQTFYTLSLLESDLKEDSLWELVRPILTECLEE